MNSILANLPPEVTTAKIGLFWIVDDRSGRDTCLAEAIDISKGEVYGPSIVSPRGHYTFWSEMQRRGPGWLRSRGLSAALLATEYEDWPRGRVSYSIDAERLILMADRRLHTPSRIALIKQAFALRDGYFDVRSDSHYQPMRLG
ncbi:hypothetical protein FJ420_21330 [Mesorhizobium sp. B3-1-3]|uniref:hypothetical protein n=1 Tax=unclassified Mesorhizobium TaxID=325217 RepID=UPI0011298CC5|nr:MULTISPECIES: hypothetical protein [unclassified Mesorhizobium]TPI59857.1 hypothetical protein FJ424_24745 [Mesorhizobium sp. B3-1-8]TPI68231.1 hypothetical protein FJ420_21330 [Mesorhizobium sp. B3-1-3]